MLITGTVASSKGGNRAENGESQRKSHGCRAKDDEAC
jgi:hypothetical protein